MFCLRRVELTLFYVLFSLKNLEKETEGKKKIFFFGSFFPEAQTEKF
jgi:hypothetical protein